MPQKIINGKTRKQKGGGIADVQPDFKRRRQRGFAARQYQDRD
jgi:hypothetical protein